MKIAVTPADQELARLDVLLAERLGEDVDPRVKLIADADLSVAAPVGDDSLPDAPGPRAVYLNDKTGEIVAVAVAEGYKVTKRRRPDPRERAARI